MNNKKNNAHALITLLIVAGSIVLTGVGIQKIITTSNDLTSNDETLSIKQQNLSNLKKLNDQYSTLAAYKEAIDSSFATGNSQIIDFKLQLDKYADENAIDLTVQEAKETTSDSGLNSLSIVQIPFDLTLHGSKVNLLSFLTYVQNEHKYSQIETFSLEEEGNGNWLMNCRVTKYLFRQNSDEIFDSVENIVQTDPKVKEYLDSKKI